MSRSFVENHLNRGNIYSRSKGRGMRQKAEEKLRLSKWPSGGRAGTQSD